MIKFLRVKGQVDIPESEYYNRYIGFIHYLDTERSSTFEEYIDAIKFQNTTYGFYDEFTAEDAQDAIEGLCYLIQKGLAKAFDD